MGIKDFESVVSAALPDVVALVPKEPAARLGRWEPKEGHRQRGTRVQTALDEIGDLLSERLLGALELAVDRLAVDIPHDRHEGARGHPRNVTPRRDRSRGGSGGSVAGQGRCPGRRRSRSR